MEGVIESHPFVEAALITYRGTAGLALLMEPQTAVAGEEQKRKCLEAIWPSVQSANEICPVEQRISKGLVATTGRMPRAAKGYLRRKMVYELYRKNIDELYRREERRMKALKDSNLAKAEVEADAQTDENWDEKLDLKGAKEPVYAEASCSD